MAGRFSTRWVVVAFVVLGALVALWMIVRGLGSDDLTEEEGTLPVTATAPMS